MNKEKYPMKLTPVPKTALWGGDLLVREYGKTSPFPKLAESWELSVRDDRNSVIANGVYAGTELREYINMKKTDAAGLKWDGVRFPLLIKFIDARDKLSVQVHPDDAYSALHHNDTGKTEVWYIVEAEPGAQLVYGLKPGIDGEGLRRAAGNGTVENCLNYVDVKAGETYFIPSGLVHAIGAGILITEIQQNCDITYRVYDYDRPDDSGKLRELHVKDACAVTRCWSEDEIAAKRFENGVNGDETLVNCSYFSVKKLSGGAIFTLDRESFACLTCIDGCGSIEWDGESYPVSKGESYFLPAGIGECCLRGGFTSLVSTANY